MATKKTDKKSLGNFLTILCSAQKITLPKNEKLQSGTIKIFNAYKPQGKVKGFNNCSGQDRSKIFSSFGKTFSYGSIKMSLDLVKNQKGAFYRTIKFSTQPEMR